MNPLFPSFLTRLMHDKGLVTIYIHICTFPCIDIHIDIYVYIHGIISQVEKAKEAIDRVEAAQLEWILRALALSPAAPRATSKGKKCSGEGCTFLAFGAFSSYLITSLNLYKQTSTLDQIESRVFMCRTFAQNKTKSWTRMDDPTY